MKSHGVRSGRDPLGPAARSADPSAVRLLGVDALDDVLEEAVGRGHRRDPVVRGTGGPAGNARLTSALGLLLVVLIAAELVTLLDVSGLIGWHVGVGIGLVALALLKTASTGWRMMRYYGGSPTYRKAGPPPLLLRLLGPMVIATTLGVLGSGIALIAVGPDASRRSAFSLLGHRADLVTLHQGFFILFAACTGVHLLARFVPAVSLTTGRPRRPGADDATVPGKVGRVALLVAVAAAAAVAVALVVPSVHRWQHERRFGPRDSVRPPGDSAGLGVAPR